MATRRRTPRVLLLIETSRAYGRGLVEGIAHYAEEHGPWSILFEERGLTDPLPRWLRGWDGDGIIARTTRRADTAKILATQLPAVELYSYFKTPLPHVCPDETAIARLAVHHFMDRGVREFAFFCAQHAVWVDGRRRAFEKIVQETGCMCRTFQVTPASLASSKPPRVLDDRKVVRWLRDLPNPCGVLCASDLSAARLVKLCRTAGILVPEQVAVLGVDNDTVFCGTSLPRLSSIDLDIARIGYEAASLLARLMSKRALTNEAVAVEPRQVVARESTDILAIGDADVAQAVLYIRQRACQRLRVSEVAAMVGLSRRTLEQRFQRELDRSPKDEILRVRMEQAKSLLTGSDIAIGLVAKKCGFASPKYFARAFRLRTGTTPQEYRNRTRF